jgi:hypothetical protein
MATRVQRQQRLRLPLGQESHWGTSLVHNKRNTRPSSPDRCALACTSKQDHASQDRRYKVTSRSQQPGHTCAVGQQLGLDTVPRPPLALATCCPDCLGGLQQTQHVQRR